MKRLLALTVVAVRCGVIPAAAEARRPYVLCGNFGGFSNPHLARKPSGCEITPATRRSNFGVCIGTAGITALRDEGASTTGSTPSA